VPRFIGTRTFDRVDLQDLVPLIDWTFFFHAWQLKGRVPAIFDHPQYGAAARELYEHAQALLARIIQDGRLIASGVYGFWPAASDDDDIVLFSDESRELELARFPMLRQQEVIADDKPNRCLADFIAPIEGERTDYIGAFAVTAGLGVDAIVQEFERDRDDYHAIMVKALADRLVEACAEYLHAKARADWRYGVGERLTPDELIAEKYRGIRPAFGYPACPDHTEKGTLFRLLDAYDLGMSLTESYAMQPAATVSGLYFAHPRARYFTVGRIGPDQVADYARRKGMTIDEIEKWLAPNLAYEPQKTVAVNG
jgi:5-methyltetrahydrofolate--homocysteine methyltransferase